MLTLYNIYKGPLDGLGLRLERLNEGDEVRVSVDVTHEIPSSSCSDGLDHTVSSPTDHEALHVFDGLELVYVKTIKLKKV